MQFIRSPNWAAEIFRLMDFLGLPFSIASMEQIRVSKISMFKVPVRAESKYSYTPFSRPPNYIHSPLAADHFSVNFSPLTATVNGFVKNASIIFNTVLKSSV